MSEKMRIEDYKNETSTRKKIVCFDPTIHAGHIMTALTILVCSIGAWYNMKEQVNMIKSQSETQQAQINKLFANEEEIEKQIHTDIEKLQDENKQWFMRLDDKLDRKMDKKGM